MALAPPEQQVLWFSEKGGPFQLAHREVPRPGPGFVLVKIESCALNPVDNFSQRTGIFVDEYPYIAGNDGSGIIEEVGEGVSELKKGDKVCVGWMLSKKRSAARRTEATTVSSKLCSEATEGHFNNTSL